MSKKYILNKTNSVLLLQKANLTTLVKLQPKQCSFQSFEETELFESPYVYRCLNTGRIELLDQRVSVIKKTNAQNYGQKYKVGTRAYLNDKNNLDIEVLSYNPNNQLYTVKLVKTGGKLTIQEAAISLKKNIGDKINIDIDENGDLTDAQDISTHRDLSLPQGPEQVQIVRTQDREVNRAINAKSLIDNQNNLADEILNQKVDVVYKDDKEEVRPEDEEETFIVKSKDGKFAKEITSSEMIENTQKAINETIQEVVDSTVVAKPETKDDGFNTEEYVKLSPELQQYISTFMSKDARGRKMIIARLKDIAKLNAIASCGDELSVKAAKAKLEKLNA